MLPLGRAGLSGTAGTPRPLRLLVVNPNTSQATTDAMVAIARAAAPEGVEIDGMTAPRGSPLITDPEALAIAAEVVAGMAPAIRAYAPDGVIVAAFGDPGLPALRGALSMPVVGIGEASIAAAARHGAFAVITTTPLLGGFHRAHDRVGALGRPVPGRVRDAG